MDQAKASEIIAIMESSKKIDEKSLTFAKKQVARKYKLNISTNIELYTSLPEKLAEKYKWLLITKPVRALSGVSVVAIMTKPRKCPHGKCSFCPGGVNSHFGDIPQSYTGHEPATMRAMRVSYDPYIQTFSRLEQYVVLGTIPEKIELIIMGGTFLSYPKKYKDEFITYSFKAMNDFSRMFFKKNTFDFAKFKRFFLLPGSIEDKTRTDKIREKIIALKKKSILTSLEKEQKKNESSNIKCVGFTIETRPDYAKKKHSEEMRRYGVTRVELGVESIYDDILLRFKRGHSVADSIDATRILRDFGFKINYHMMLGLCEKKKDIKMFEELFSNPDFKPDMLKIYPCMIFPGTELYDDWKKGRYHPLMTKDAAEEIAEIKKHMPEYVRIMRIQRDIPTKMVVAGVGITNLRQYVDGLLADKKIKCRCIRCREIKNQTAGKIDLIVREYDASGGKEFFISAEDVKKDLLLGFARLRFPAPNATRMTGEITKNSALIRELHVYGSATAIGEVGLVQHKGIGKQLMQKAEEIAKSDKKDKLVIISGIGVRGYYRKIGYKLEGTYMVKKLDCLI